MRWRRVLLPRIGVGVAFVSITAFTLSRLTPPAADLGGFSTDRALAHLRFIASETRAVGLPHNHAVRAYLMNELARLGYDVQANEAVAAIPLTNIIAQKLGSQPGARAILLVAHYDSVRSGPGAGDNASGVCALLEVARLLANRPSRNDIVFLLTDSEELGLRGARLFVYQNPRAADVAVALNFDARGSSGPSIMFETTDRDGWLIDLYARHAPHPVCSSLSADVYRMMPNKTDFTILRDIPGVAGLNFAFIGNYASYHSIAAPDDIDHLDPRSLRHHGIQAMAIVEALGNIDLADHPLVQDLVYFDLLSFFVVRYPAGWALTLSIGVSAIAGLVGAWVIWRNGLSIKRIAAAIGLVIVNILLASAVSWVIVRFTRGPTPHRYADLCIAGYAILAAGITLAGFYLWRSVSSLELAAAGLIVWILLTLASAFVLRGGSYLTAWPLLAATGAMAIRASTRRPTVAGFIGLVTLMAPIIILLAPIMYLAFLGLTVNAAPIVIVPIVLTFWLLPCQLKYDASDGNVN